MSVENALKMLKDEKIALEREAVKIERAIKALESSGITRSRATSNGGQPAKKVAVRDQDNEANMRAILEYIHHNPGTTVRKITDELGMTSEGYVYARVRKLASAGAIIHTQNTFPREWQPA